MYISCIYLLSYFTADPLSNLLTLFPDRIHMCFRGSKSDCHFVNQRLLQFQHAAYVLGGRVGIGETQYCARCVELDPHPHPHSLLIYTPAPPPQHVKPTVISTPPSIFFIKPMEFHQFGLLDPILFNSFLISRTSANLLFIGFYRFSYQLHY